MPTKKANLAVGLKNLRQGQTQFRPAFACFFTERVLPDPAARTVTRELLASRMRDTVIADLWHGPATLRLEAPELAPLAVEQVLGGRANTVSWIKDESRLLRRVIEAFPAR